MANETHSAIGLPSASRPHDRHLAGLMLAPAVLVLFGLSLYPLIFLLRVSLTTAEGAWTLAHFSRLFQDRFFGVALLQTFAYTGVALALEFGLGLGLALLLNRQLAFRRIFRATLLLPMLLPPVVVAVIWRLIYNPNFGLLNASLAALGIDTSNWLWIAGQKSALLSVILVDVWEWTPFMFLLLLAGLQSLPVEPYEAAKIDGASAWQTFRDITWPLLKPIVLVAVLLRILDLLRVFDQIFILTQGGPGFATETASLYIYRNAFRFFNFGYAAALSLALLALTTAVSLWLVRLLRGRALAPGTE
ncbi:MAG: sugar ABC transporter permease [Acidobacteria bacterium]|nr:sugar ABC transporter permease [Acidobacteriota bacterium]